MAYRRSGRGLIKGLDFLVRTMYNVYITWGNIVISNENRKRDMARYGYPLCETVGAKA